MRYAAEISGTGGDALASGLAAAYGARCGDPLDQAADAVEAMLRGSRGEGPVRDAVITIRAACRLRAVEGKHWPDLVQELLFVHVGRVWLQLADQFGEGPVAEQNGRFSRPFGEEITRRLDAVRDGQAPVREGDIPGVFEWVATLLEAWPRLAPEFPKNTGVMAGIALSGRRWILYEAPGEFYLWGGDDDPLIGPMDEAGVDALQERCARQRQGFLGRLTGPAPWALDPGRPRFRVMTQLGGHVQVVGPAPSIVDFRA